MSHLFEAIFKFHSLDEIALKRTPIHKIHPLAKILITLIYILFLISFDKYELSQMVSYTIFPLFILILGEIPFKVMIGPILASLSFVIFLGIFGLLFDHTSITTIGGIIITGGVISFCSLILKTVLSMTATISLIATTGIQTLSATLIFLKVPRIFVMQLLFLYRYIIILLEESYRTTSAYRLRSQGQSLISLKNAGTLLGQLLLRTYNRADRIHSAMIMRGFNGTFKVFKIRSLKSIDMLYIIGWLTFFIIARLFNFSYFLGHFILNIG